jgi:hypothetical protein
VVNESILTDVLEKAVEEVPASNNGFLPHIHAKTIFLREYRGSKVAQYAPRSLERRCAKLGANYCGNR